MRSNQAEYDLQLILKEMESLCELLPQISIITSALQDTLGLLTAERLKNRNYVRLGELVASIDKSNITLKNQKKQVHTEMTILIDRINRTKEQNQQCM